MRSSLTSALAMWPRLAPAHGLVSGVLVPAELEPMVRALGATIMFILSFLS